MVKNNFGGNKAKGFARKNLTTKRDSSLRVASEEGEIYAQAVKVMGGNIVSAIDINGNPLKAHIRGKFRGKGKRDNFIGPNTWLLVGLHEWGSDDTIKSCDILEVYSDIDKNRLKNSINSVNWSKFIINDNKTVCDNNEENETGIYFADNVAQEYEELISAKETTNKISVDNSEIIDIEDI
jgi:hypothetical protein